jgi:hypothetical protein
MRSDEPENGGFGNPISASQPGISIPPTDPFSHSLKQFLGELFANCKSLELQAHTNGQCGIHVTTLDDRESGTFYKRGFRHGIEVALRSGAMKLSHQAMAHPTPMIIDDEDASAFGSALSVLSLISSFTPSITLQRRLVIDVGPSHWRSMLYEEGAMMARGLERKTQREYKAELAGAVPFHEALARLLMGS